MISESWDKRKDGRTDQETATALMGGNTREIQACPVFRDRVHKLFLQGKVSIDVTHAESLTDVTIDRTNKYKDKSDAFIELLYPAYGSRSGKIEFKIQPKLYDGRSKQLMPKVALKENSCDACIKKHQPMVIVNRWNPLEYSEEVGNPKWLVLSVGEIKTLGVDTHGYADSIPLREYTNRDTGECQPGFRLLERAPVEKYNDQWIDWTTFEPIDRVEVMLRKIWNDLGKQNG